jgi:hypothetical protein
MSEHTVTVDWKRETSDFAYETYNRDHDWVFDAGGSSDRARQSLRTIIGPLRFTSNARAA